VLWHADDTLSLYSGAIEEPVEADTVLLRGQWLGRLAAEHRAKRPSLRFEHRRAGEPLDPSASLVGN
jgi:septal ring factor EnvC (AmiA/AmiB activator)